LTKLYIICLYWIKKALFRDLTQGISCELQRLIFHRLDSSSLPTLHPILKNSMVALSQGILTVLEMDVM